MTAARFDTFRDSLAGPAPPPGLTGPLQALWWAGKGDWSRAHDIAQVADDADHCLVHAYLHRVEGDTGNAAYWYRRAGARSPTVPLAEEWETISRRMLAG